MAGRIIPTVLPASSSPDFETGDPMSAHVILLHGLWMRAFTLVALRHRLEQASYSVELFDYASVLRGPEVSVEHLLRRAQAARTKQIHFVGHSLGGLIALQ